MTRRDKPVGNDATAGKDKCSSSGKAAKPVASEERERHFLDTLEDDEVKEALRLGRQPRKGSTATGST